MRKLLPYLACLMLVLTTWASIGHATEVSGCADVTATEASAHVDGDGDQVPADADTPFPHHHGNCHGHHVGTLMTSVAVAHALDASSRLARGTDTITAATEPDLGRRPPKA